MSARTFVDTNVLVYMLDDSEPEKQAIAERTLRAERQDGDPTVSIHVLGEMFAALTRQRGGPGKRRAPLLEPDEAEAAVRALAEFSIVQVDRPILLDGMARARRHRLGFRDALHVATALAHGCTTFLTEDLQDGRVIDGMVVRNPFAPHRR